MMDSETILGNISPSFSQRATTEAGQPWSETITASNVSYRGDQLLSGAGFSFDARGRETDRTIQHLQRVK